MKKTFMSGIKMRWIKTLGVFMLFFGTLCFSTDAQAQDANLTRAAINHIDFTGLVDASAALNIISNEVEAFNNASPATPQEEAAIGVKTVYYYQVGELIGQGISVQESLLSSYSYMENANDRLKPAYQIDTQAAALELLDKLK